MAVTRKTTHFPEKDMLGAPMAPSTLFMDRREVATPNWPDPIDVIAKGALGRIAKASVAVPGLGSRGSGDTAAVTVDCSYEIDPPVIIDPDDPAGTLNTVAEVLAEDAVDALRTLRQGGFAVRSVRLNLDMSGEVILARDDDDGHVHDLVGL